MSHTVASDLGLLCLLMSVSDMLSLPKIMGGTRENSFSHASWNLKKKISRKKEKSRFWVETFWKATLVNWKNSGSIQSSPNIDRKCIKVWTEWETRIKHENQSVLMPLLHCGKGLSKMAKKIGISGALLPEKTCYNKLKHCNLSSRSYKKRETRNRTICILLTS